MAKAKAEKQAAAVTETDLSPLSEEEGAQLARHQAKLEMDRLAKEAEEAASEHLERGEILVERVIDPHEGRLATVLSYWRPLTPSLCPEARCGYDAAEAVGFREGWDSIPEDMPFDQKQSMREFVVTILERHKSIRHPASAPKHIRTAEEAAAARRAPRHPRPEGFVTNPNV